MSDLFATLRARTARVMERARAVRIEPEGVSRLAERLARERPPAPRWDAETHHRGSEASTLAYVVTLAAVNFGSGWFPRLRKRPGRSGYFTIAMGLTERFDAAGPWSAAELTKIDLPALARVLGQAPDDPASAELLGLFVSALHDLGALLLERHAGRFEGLVERAGGSAEAFVRELAVLPGFRDVARYEEIELPFYKRAQLAVADLALALGGRGAGRFRDLASLTAFADNLVPHVLRVEGALRYTPELRARIESGQELAAGSPEEVEIRAAAVHGVELLVDALRRRGSQAGAHEIDFVLWHRGQRPEIKAHPRHRTRTIFY